MSDVFSSAGRVHDDSTYITPLLSEIAAQAAQADATRSVSADLIARIKQNDIMRMSASPEISGLDQSIVNIGNELRAIAAHCGSTAWCLWNHLCTLHHFVGLLGPEHTKRLGEAVAKREWFCFPAGASSQVMGVRNGTTTTLSGVAAFGSGGRYAEWAGVVFMVEGTEVPCFALADLRSPQVRIRETWDGMSVRASATDHIHYEGLVVPNTHIAAWPLRHREQLRDPAYPVIHARYREDWVGLAVLWLGAMATGVAEVSLRETIDGIRDRIAILGTRMADRPTIHVNLGRARALINAATDTVYAAMVETDARIAARQPPTEADYFRQASAGMQAVHLCDEAMRLVLRVLGGNGLREGSAFERRYRDFQAMPLHILGHIDRVTEQMGRIALGLDSQNPL
ncbi:acyl-CoA dehydrogenase family protein [Panacagrimonas sp.]|uniref:acyl-CoA dehydrogenase family protein n=1 Tax=Panacagrimonas sp. TaxID=2480088 RepID=UPI003B519050